MIIGLLMNHVWAYLSSEVKATGSVKYNIKYANAKITMDTVSELKRNIKITNTGNTSCYVRIRIIGTDNIGIAYSSNNNGEDRWTDGGDGFWYYEKVLEPGESTINLEIEVYIYDSQVENKIDCPIVAEATEIIYQPQSQEPIPNGPSSECWYQSFTEE